MIVSFEEHFQVKLIEKDEIHVYIRKSAHVFNYFILGVFFTLAWRAFGLKKTNPYWLAWQMAALCSAIDEYYQTFVQGRNGELRDFLVDNIGVILGLGLGLVALIGFIRRKRIVYISK